MARQAPWPGGHHPLATVLRGHETKAASLRRRQANPYRARASLPGCKVNQGSVEFRKRPLECVLKSSARARIEAIAYKNHLCQVHNFLTSLKPLQGRLAHLQVNIAENVTFLTQSPPTPPCPALSAVQARHLAWRARRPAKIKRPRRARSPPCAFPPGWRKMRDFRFAENHGK